MKTLLACIVLAAPIAVADEGEAHLGAAAALEVASLQHPLAAPTTGIHFHPLVLPRVSVATRYGLTNDWQLGVAVDAGGATNVATDDVTLAGRKTRLVTGGLLELALPLGVRWRVDSGYDVSALVGIDLAPTVAIWSSTAATDPTSGELPRRLPIDVADAVTIGARGCASLAIDVRLLEALHVRAGAYAGIAWAGTPSVRVGFIVEPSWIFAVGPR